MWNINKYICVWRTANAAIGLTIGRVAAKGANSSGARESAKRERWAVFFAHWIAPPPNDLSHLISGGQNENLPLANTERRSSSRSSGRQLWRSDFDFVLPRSKPDRVTGQNSCPIKALKNPRSQNSVPIYLGPNPQVLGTSCAKHKAEVTLSLTVFQSRM